jgi:hypothetical protein
MSNFQITPIGVALIGIYSGIVWLVVIWPVSRLLKTSRLRWPIAWIVAIPFLAAPWAEEAWIAWHFAEACKDAGVKVYRQVEVEGYVNDSSRSSRKSANPGLWKLDQGSLKSFDSADYRFTENMLDDGGVLRVERHYEGLLATVLDRPTGRYHLRYTYQPTYHSHEEPVGWKLEKVERQVVDSQTGEILGRDVTVKRWAPMADALWAQFIGSTLRMCPGPNVQPYEPPPPFPQAVLKPISRP